MLWVTGCSCLGISLYPAGHFLTEQAECVVDQSPRQAYLPRELSQTVLPTHYLQPGDVLLVEPVDLESKVRFPADQKVLADGTIDLNEFGRVIVAGLTLEDAERLIQNTIVEFGADATQINVRLIEPVHRYYVLGEVASPGSYPFSGNETVLDGILAAGGLTSQAALCDLVLARPTTPTSCRVALPICYSEITQLGDTSTNYQLQPGDRIFVGSRSFCDELMFWKATETCDRCCNSQSACTDPNVASFRNPLASFLASPPRIPSPPPSTARQRIDDVIGRRRDTRSSTHAQPLDEQDAAESQLDPSSLELQPLRPLRRRPLPELNDEPLPAPTYGDGELRFSEPIPAP